MTFQLYQMTKAEEATFTVLDYYQKNLDKFKQEDDVLMEGTLIAENFESKNSSVNFDCPAFITKKGYVVMLDWDMTYELYMASIPLKMYILDDNTKAEFPIMPFQPKGSHGYVTLAIHPEAVYEGEIKDRLEEIKREGGLNEIVKSFNYPDHEFKNIDAVVSTNPQNFIENLDNPVANEILEKIEAVKKAAETAEVEMKNALENKKMLIVESSPGTGKFALIDKVVEQLGLEIEEIELDNSFAGTVQELANVLKSDFKPGQIILLDSTSATKPNLVKFLEATKDLGVQLIVVDHLAKENQELKIAVQSFDNIDELVNNYTKPKLSKQKILDNIQGIKEKAEADNTNSSKNKV